MLEEYSNLMILLAGQLGPTFMSAGQSLKILNLHMWLTFFTRANNRRTVFTYDIFGLVLDRLIANPNFNPDSMDQYLSRTSLKHDILQQIVDDRSLYPVDLMYMQTAAICVILFDFATLTRKDPDEAMLFFSEYMQDQQYVFDLSRKGYGAMKLKEKVAAAKAKRPSVIGKFVDNVALKLKRQDSKSDSDSDD